MNDFRTPVPQGRVCLWYQGGDTSREPMIALVTKESDTGGLGLSVFGPNYKIIECMSGVRHRRDPFLAKRPNHAKENGCWDYLPEPPPPQIHTVKEPSSQPAIPATSPEMPPIATQELKDRMAELATEGKNAIEIAADLTASTGQKWSHQRVNALLRHLPRTALSEQKV